MKLDSERALVDLIGLDFISSNAESLKELALTQGRKAIRRTFHELYRRLMNQMHLAPYEAMNVLGGVAANIYGVSKRCTSFDDLLVQLDVVLKQEESRTTIRHLVSVFLSHLVGVITTTELQNRLEELCKLYIELEGDLLREAVLQAKTDYLASLKNSDTVSELADKVVSDIVELAKSGEEAKLLYETSKLQYCHLGGFRDDPIWSMVFEEVNNRVKLTIEAFYKGESQECP